MRFLRQLLILCEAGLLARWFTQQSWKQYFNVLTNSFHYDVKVDLMHKHSFNPYCRHIKSAGMCPHAGFPLLRNILGRYCRTSCCCYNTELVSPWSTTFHTSAINSPSQPLPWSPWLCQRARALGRLKCQVACNALRDTALQNSYSGSSHWWTMQFLIKWSLNGKSCGHSPFAIGIDLCMKFLKGMGIVLFCILHCQGISLRSQHEKNTSSV